MSLRESANNNKENIPISLSTASIKQPLSDSIEDRNAELVQKLQQDLTKLERLYKDEVIKGQQVMDEQERLEIELLGKEKSIYQQQQHLQKMTELNKSLSKKLSGELSYYESALGNYRKMEKEWDDKFKKLSAGHTKFEHMIKRKNDELNEINQELEIVKNEVDNKDVELRRLALQLEQALQELKEMNLKKLLHRHHKEEKQSIQHGKKFHDGDFSSEDEEDLRSIVIHEEEEEEAAEESFDISGNSSSLAHEFNHKINDNDKAIKKYQFEIKSLKNEKHQLYNYINKLLKNKPHPDQNSVLKEKLVKRKILRAISINQVTHDSPHDNASVASKSSSIMRSGKRVLSNVVHFKSYQNLNKTSLAQENLACGVNEQNSDCEEPQHGDPFKDEEEVDEDEIRLIGNQNLGHNLYARSSPYFMINPIEILLRAKQQEQKVAEQTAGPQEATGSTGSTANGDEPQGYDTIELDID